MKTVKTLAKVATVKFDLACAYHTKKEQFKEWVHNKTGEILALLFQWAFSKHAVQHAIVSTITCQTPIGRMLNEHIESYVDDSRNNIDVDNISGLERFVESAIDDFVSHSLEEHVNGAIDISKVAEQVAEEPDFQEEMVKAVMEELASRLRK